MKKLLFYTCLFSLLFVVGCGKETVDPEGPEIPEEPGNGYAITFIFAGAAGENASYASLSAENELLTLDIYQFDTKNGQMTLERILKEVSLQTSGEDKQTTLIFNEESATKTFYFIGNGGTILSLENVVAGVTTLNEFKELITNQQATHLPRPLLQTAFAEDVEIGVTHSETMTLSRRVGRFDVQNDSTQSGYVIEKIIVQNIRTATHLFGNAITTFTPQLGDLPDLSFKEFENANIGLSEGVFYLYPSMNRGETQLAFLVRKVGENNTSLYQLNTSSLKIEVNERHTLTITQ